MLSKQLGVEVEVKLTSGPPSFDQIVTDPLDHRIIALNLPSHHSLIIMLRFLEVPRIVVGETQEITGLELQPLITLLPGELKHFVEVLHSRGVHVQHPVCMPELAIAYRLLAEPPLVLAETLQFFVLHYGVSEIFKLEEYVCLQLQGIIGQVELLMLTEHAMNDAIRWSIHQTDQRECLLAFLKDLSHQIHTVLPSLQAGPLFVLQLVQDVC